MFIYFYVIQCYYYFLLFVLFIHYSFLYYSFVYLARISCNLLLHTLVHTLTYTVKKAGRISIRNYVLLFMLSCLVLYLIVFCDYVLLTYLRVQQKILDISLHITISNKILDYVSILLGLSFDSFYYDFDVDYHQSTIGLYFYSSVIYSLPTYNLTSCLRCESNR